MKLKWNLTELKKLLSITCLILFFAQNILYAQIEYASWYSIASCKKEGTWKKYNGRMANGKKFNDNEYTCASWFYKFGTYLRITNLRNMRSVTCTVTDRGPSRRLVRTGRTVDLSKAAFATIADCKQGVIPVTIKVINEKRY